jgi:uncharacterized protein YbaR (Trm112 family)
MDIQLLEVLVCPICKGILKYMKEEKELMCSVDHLAYPIRDDIPVMIETSARIIE